MKPYSVRFPAQLRQHLRALRKHRSLTQAQLGELLGVSQARIAEIEANPGLVSFEQLMQLFSALGVTVSLSTNETAQNDSSPQRQANLNLLPASGNKISAKTDVTSRGGEQNPKNKDTEEAAGLKHLIIERKKGSW